MSYFSLLLLVLGALLMSPAAALQCTSQTFSTKAHYDTCSDLPTLKAFLHWTYNETKSTLSVAFVAAPAAADGWIAWGINPTGAGMIGTQAFIAFKDAQGKVAVKTYNLTSYGAITPQKLSLTVLDSRAEAAADGVMRIFATVELPEKMATVNHVWQVGASVKDGIPQKHQMLQENLDAKAALQLTAGNTISDAPSPAAAAAPGGADGKNTAISPASGQTTGCEPWDLPRKAKMMGKKEWFFFWQKDRKYPTGTRTNRATESGYWKATGKDKEIFQSGRGSSSIVGMKKTLVFYKGRAPKGQKTNWIMHEYRLHGTQFYNSTREEWVVCRVFHKQTTGVVYMRRSPPRNDAVSRIDSISVADHLLQTPSKLPPLTDFPDYSDDKPPAPPLLPCSLTLQNPPSALFYPPNPNSGTATAALKAESVSQDAAGVVSPDVTPREISWELPDGGGALGGLYDDSMADLDRYYSFLNYY